LVGELVEPQPTDFVSICSKKMRCPTQRTLRALRVLASWTPPHAQCGDEHSQPLNGYCSCSSLVSMLAATLPLHAFWPVLASTSTSWCCSIRDWPANQLAKQLSVSVPTEASVPPTGHQYYVQI